MGVSPGKYGHVSAYVDAPSFAQANRERCPLQCKGILAQFAYILLIFIFSRLGLGSVCIRKKFLHQVEIRVNFL